MATQQEVNAARKRLEAQWDTDGDCCSCGWHAALYEHQVEDWEIANSLDTNNGIIELPCQSKDAEDRYSHRGVKISIKSPDNSEAKE